MTWWLRDLLSLQTTALQTLELFLPLASKSLELRHVA
jgi:hypothetical protein